MLIKRIFLRKIVITFILFVNLFNFILYYDNLNGQAILNQTVETVKVSYLNPSELIIDGVITQGEYLTSYTEEITEISVHFSHNGSFLFVGLVSPGTGWLGIGFGPEGVGMNEANILIGYVKDGSLTWEDHYGIGISHVNDLTMDSGADNLGNSAGDENNTHTTVEFSIPLSSGDSYDHNFIVGETYGFYVANNPVSDDLTSYHPEHSDTISLYIETTAIIMPKVMEHEISIDGEILDDEYAQTIYDFTTETTVFFQHNETMMFIGLSSPNKGWLSIGFGPSGIGMNGSNIIIGYVDQLGLSIQDNYGISDNHLSDTSNGGTDDIKASAGSENATHTVIEFIYPLATANFIYDYNFTVGKTYGFFLSHNPTKDDFISMHPEHSITYNFFISDIEQLEADITLTATDDKGNTISSGDTLPQGSVINIKAKLSFANKNNGQLKGILINFNINSTFGLKRVESNFTDLDSSITFSKNLTSVKGKIEFIVELPKTSVGEVVISRNQAIFSLFITPLHEEELYFFDDPVIFDAISVGIVGAVGLVFLTYFYVLYNTGRIFSKGKKSNLD